MILFRNQCGCEHCVCLFSVFWITSWRKIVVSLGQHGNDHHASCHCSINSACGQSGRSPHDSCRECSCECGQKPTVVGRVITYTCLKGKSTPKFFSICCWKWRADSNGVGLASVRYSALEIFSDMGGGAASWRQSWRRAAHTAHAPTSLRSRRRSQAQMWHEEDAFCFTFRREEVCFFESSSCLSRYVGIWACFVQQ